MLIKSLLHSIENTLPEGHNLMKNQFYNFEL